MIGVKEIFWNALQMLEHNDQHCTTIHPFGKTINACSRCLGMYIGMLVALPIVILFSSIGTYNFWHIFGFAWFLALFPIADWATVKAGIREGNNNVRIVTGFMLGSAGLIYLFLLPINVISPVSFGFKYLTLCIYGFVFSIAHYGVKCGELNLSLKNPVRQNLAVIYAASPLAVASGTIGCGQTGGCGSFCNCCPCGGGCCCSPLCCCIGICPLICIIKSAMDKKAPPKGVTNAKK